MKKRIKSKKTIFLITLAFTLLFGINKVNAACTYFNENILEDDIISSELTPQEDKLQDKEYYKKFFNYLNNTYSLEISYNDYKNIFAKSFGGNYIINYSNNAFTLNQTDSSLELQYLDYNLQIDCSYSSCTFKYCTYSKEELRTAYSVSKGASKFYSSNHDHEVNYIDLNEEVIEKPKMIDTIDSIFNNLFARTKYIFNLFVTEDKLKYILTFSLVSLSIYILIRIIRK